MTVGDSARVLGKNQFGLPLSFTEFIERARKKHGGKYEYGCAKYVNLTTKINIVCPKHGDFEQLPSFHIARGGCPKCGIERRGEKRRMGVSEFISQAKEVHGDKYDYSQTNYAGYHEPLKIICRRHGEFMQNPSNHLKGKGCIKCSGCNKKDTKQFIEEARSIHGDNYSYEKSEYKNAKSKLIIICKDHGEFLQVAREHLKGRGCQECGSLSKSSYVRSYYVANCKKRHKGFANLYLIHCFGAGESFYKIGITATTLAERFSRNQIPYKYTVLRFINAEAGFIWDLEKRLHAILKRSSYAPKMSFGGETECFSDIPKSVFRLLDKIDNSGQMQLIA